MRVLDMDTEVSQAILIEVSVWIDSNDLYVFVFIGLVVIVAIPIRIMAETIARAEDQEVMVCHVMVHLGE